MSAPWLSSADGVATITLADPDGVNALGPERVAQLRAVIEEADADPHAGVILVRADARAFSAGGDIHWFAAQVDAVHDGILGLADDAAEVIRLLHETPKITIAAVAGAAAGGGLGVALACDLVLAARDATFVTSYVRIGASPDLGVSAFLVRDVGYRRALELYLLSEPVDAPTALELGLVNRVVDAGALDDTAIALARRIAAGPRDAHAAAKRLLQATARRELRDHLRDELHTVADLGRGDDWHEGIAAFVEGRAPRFGEATSRRARSPLPPSRR